MLTIKHPITGQDFLMVGLKDFPDYMEYKAALHACEKLGEGWRLPTLMELNEIYLQLYKNDLGEFDSCEYWALKQNPDDLDRSFDFCFGHESLLLGHYPTGKVRAVKPL
jgi:hypothetical protein